MNSPLSGVDPRKLHQSVDFTSRAMHHHASPRNGDDHLHSVDLTPDIFKTMNSNNNLYAQEVKSVGQFPGKSFRKGQVFNSIQVKTSDRQVLQDTNESRTTTGHDG